MRPGDIEKLAVALDRDFGDRLLSQPVPWDAAPAVKVIDCVLSLGRNYQRAVVPRVEGFASSFPQITSCTDLACAMRASDTPSEFLERALKLRDPSRAVTLLGVADFAVAVQSLFPAPNEPERLRRWATWARPGDALAVEVRGFGVAGFQYLRMHFGADTIKPDVHIGRYVLRVLDRSVGEVAMVWLLERACEALKVSPSSVDARIWEAATHTGEADGRI